MHSTSVEYLRFHFQVVNGISFRAMRGMLEVMNRSMRQKQQVDKSSEDLQLGESEACTLAASSGQC